VLAQKASATISVSTGDYLAARTLGMGDFHQSPERLNWLRRNGIDTRLFVALRGSDAVASVLFEWSGDRWFSWKGPSGPEPSVAVLARLLATCADLAPVTLVLRPEWIDHPVLGAAGYVEGGCFTTLLVPTGGSESDILGRMKPATRRQVRRGIHSDLQFVEGPAEIERFYPVYAAAMIEAGSPDFATFAELASLVAMPQVRLFVALAGEQIAAGSLCFDNANAFEARYVATNAAFRRLGALNFVHFHTIQRAARAGRPFFDLSGIACGDVDTKLANINRFKMGFGGARYDYPVFTRD
jgi:Acetyltransferase (GNAT) domain